MSTAHPDDSGQWVLLQYKIDGLPVVMKAMEALPGDEARNKYTWLTVVTWRYDGTERNGMPSDEINVKMIALEKAIDELQERQLCMQVYTRTGNHVKELVYYIGDRDVFMEGFNEVLADHPRYPLEIDFYEDPAWEDLQTVQKNYLNEK